MSRTERIIHGVICAAGCATLALALIALGLLGIAAVEKAVCQPKLQEGVVTGFSYDDGHTWYSELTFGRYTLRKAHGDGRDHYYAAVTDGRREDLWEISREKYYELKIGQEVRRNQVQ